MCNNEHKCDVNVTTSAFGEPCLGVYKYLNVSFKCGECDNKNAQCDHWASMGECSSNNAAWMEANCRKACWKCETDPTVHTIVCEGKNAKLSCTNDMSLRIMGVFYGRKDNSICPHTAIHSNSCGETTAPFQRAHKLCTGRNKCKVDVYSKTMGGDTCPGTYKYMELDYRCQACENALGNDTRCEALASQGECLTNPQYMYRACFLTCSKCSIPACGNLHNSCEYYAMAGECVKTKDWMKINCIESCRWCPEASAMTTTTVSPTTTVTPGGDTDIMKNVSTCEGYTMQITCPKGKAISIKSAFYGRHGNETCPHVKAPADADCHDTTALSKLRQLCNAYENCGVDIFTSKLGDPCPGIYKYANITYKCIARSEIRCELDCGTHGVCIGDNTCACNKGYKGEACNKFSCSEVNECSGHGTCSGPNKCRCDGSWLGDTCDVPSCSGVNHCSNQGRCIGVDKCFCYPFFSGATCSKCDTSFPAGGSKTCLPCPQCQHGTCVQKTEANAENSSYVGCFKDKQNDRDLEHLAWDSDANLSTVKCVLKCYLIGYKFAGLQDGNRCYCGNDYGRHGDADTCDTKCSGTVEGDVCGGRLATSVWRVTAGYCECDGPNWTGTSCDRCSAGYSGPLCVSDSTTTTTTTTTSTNTATTTKPSTTKPTTTPTTPEVGTTTIPSETPTTTTPTVAVTTTTVATAATTSTIATTTSSIATASPVSTTTKEPEKVTQTTSTTTKQAVITTTTNPTVAPSSTRTVKSTSSAAVPVTSPESTVTDQPSVTSPPDTDGSTTEIETPHIGAKTMKRRVTLTMTLQMPWKPIYNNRADPQTKEFETNLTHTLIEIYNSNLQPTREVTDVIITDIRKGSVVVEHEMVLKEPFAGAEEEDVLCLINEAVQETDTVVGAAASLSQQTEQMCAKRASFCENGGTVNTYENGTWYCVCASGTTGDRCENSKSEVIVTIVIIVIVCTVPLLLIMGLCYGIEMRAAKQRKAKAAFVGTSVSYRYQDLSRAQKSAPRRLFQGQSMTENADVDGFEPRQI